LNEKIEVERAGELKKIAVQLMAEKLECLTVWSAAAWERFHRLKELAAVAVQVPSENVSERVRYETHLSLEMDRTLNRHERIQKIQWGYPAPQTSENSQAAKILVTKI